MAPAAPLPDGGVNPAVVAPAEVLRQVRRLELRTRRLVDSSFAGEYRSLFKGQGMEFAEVRQYQPGDEVRSIDWNVSARMGRPFVKRYVEERELTVMLAIDLSGSSRVGTRARFKHDLAIEMAGVLALAAVRNNDRVGLVLFSDRIEHALPARKGRKHALRLIRDLMVAEPVGRGTSFAVAVDHLARLLPHRSVVFLCSDFLGADLERPLARLAQRHDVITVTLQDPAERELPDIGPARLEDPETGERVVVDTSDPAVRAAFADRVARDDEARRRLFGRLGLDEIVVHTEDGYVEALLEFFRARARRPHGAVRTGPRGVLGAPLRRIAGALLAATLAAMAALSLPATLPAQGDPARASVTDPQAARIRAGVVVRPETVTVGDPFVLLATVELPADGRVSWPAIDDTLAPVSMRAPVRVRSVERERRELTAEYQLAAWAVGVVPVGLPDAIVSAGGRTVRVPLTAQVVVRSVLPGDTALHVPKPAKALFPREVPWWTRWWPVAAVLAALALLAWLVARRRRPTFVVPAGVDVHARALHEFDRLERLALVDAGERGRYVALAVDVMRLYLAARCPAASLAHTGGELVAAVADDARVPHGALAELLAEAEAVKFAHRPLDGAQARVLAALARRIVDEVEIAEQARRAAEEAERRAAQAEAAEARAEAEDDARRRSRRRAGV